MSEDTCVFSSRYRCVIPDHDVIFDDRLDVIAWMEWCVGKSEKPPERFLKKELDKAIRSRVPLALFLLTLSHTFHAGVLFQFLARGFIVQTANVPLCVI